MVTSIVPPRGRRGLPGDIKVTPIQDHIILGTITNNWTIMVTIGTLLSLLLGVYLATAAPAAVKPVANAQQRVVTPGYYHYYSRPVSAEEQDTGDQAKEQQAVFAPAGYYHYYRRPVSTEEQDTGDQAKEQQQQLVLSPPGYYYYYHHAEEQNNAM